MTGVLLGAGLACALWAGLLALAEESPRISRAIGLPPGAKGEAVPVHRALFVSRLVLVLLAGALTAAALRWWDRPVITGFGVALLSAVVLYLVADAVPRGAAGLAPKLSDSAVGLAKASLIVFKPLLGIVNAADRITHSIIPTPASSGALRPGQRDMLLGVFSLGDTTVGDIMTPRLDVAAIDADAPWSEVVDLLRRSEHARIPVYQGNLDDVAGILHAKDLVPSISGVRRVPERWQDLARPAQFVPESKTNAAQLRDFQRGPSHLAIVVDEFGGTSGLITLEDVLEEIVGEIHDEYDADEEPAVEREGDDRFWVDGSLPLDELGGVLDAQLERDEVSTVGGLIYSELGRVPRPGEELRIGDFRVVLEQVVRRRIRRVYFERIHASADTQVSETE